MTEKNSLRVTKILVAAIVFIFVTAQPALAVEIPSNFRVEQTGSTWNVSGMATSGELAGTQLTQITSDDQFWFALAAFFPDRDIRG